MEWWWRWGATLGLLLALSGAATAAPPPVAELQAVRMRPADSGQTLLLHLSAPVDARVSAVRGRNGRLARLYVDLPVGTRAAPGARRLSPAPPVAGARVGQGDDGAPRIVVELADATGYRVSREQDGHVLAVTLSRPPEPPRRAAAAARPSLPAEAADDTAAVPAQVPVPVAVAPPPAAAPRVRRKIVIDPGHGGDDPGAMGFAIEKDVTLAIATRLAALLRERLGADVVLTRDADVTLPLSARTARANTENADLFVSVHANANETGRLRGIETYYLNNSDDHATLRLASMENGLGEFKPTAGETDLRYILSDLVQGGKMEESAALAASIQRGVVGRLRRKHDDVVDLGVKRGPFYVLVGAHMPCVLVETSFLSHPVEGRRLASQDYQWEVAEGIFQGIDRFFADVARTATL